MITQIGSLGPFLHGHNIATPAPGITSEIKAERREGGASINPCGRKSYPRSSSWLSLMSPWPELVKLAANEAEKWSSKLDTLLTY